MNSAADVVVDRIPGNAADLEERALAIQALAQVIDLR